jgi:DNA-binding CsgD family transcriptional regulator
MLEVFADGLRELTSSFVADSFLSRGCYRSAEVTDWNELPQVQSGRLRSVGVADCLQINATEPDGFGAWFGSFCRSREPLEREAHLNLVRVQRHLAAATRMLSRLQGAAPSPDRAGAVLDPGGRVRSATGPASERSQREELEHAVRSVDKARCRKKRGNPDAVDEWPALVSGWWTLVEHFERDGRRYVLAIENRPRGPGIDLLSERERQVVQLALLGRDNKEIAYELGLSHSTVRVLVARSATKLGVRSREALLAKARDLSRTQTARL